MPATIQVILQEDVQNVGTSGELVKVRPGFARNYLLPRKLASPATTAQINRLNHEKAVAQVRSEKLKKEFRDLADKIGALEIKIAHKVGEDDRLFGSVTAKEIHHAVEAKGLTLDRKKIALKEPIRTLGTFEVPVKLMSDVTATLKVEVVKK
jgi:large subunit ribosomal protein L9